MSDMIPTIDRAYATGEQIEAIINKVEPILDGELKNHVVIAMTVLLLITMKPTISAEQLQEGVKNVTDYICLVLGDFAQTDEEGRVVLN